MTEWVSQKIIAPVVPKPRSKHEKFRENAIFRSASGDSV